MGRNDRFRWAVRPLAEKENMVQGTRFRFTVLTSRLIRLEYSPGGCFEDRASQSVFYRDFPPVPFTIDREKGEMILETEHLVLTYREDAPFRADTLCLRLKQEPLHKKTTRMYWQARQTIAVSDALKELLSLTECEYLGSQLS